MEDLDLYIISPKGNDCPLYQYDYPIDTFEAASGKLFKSAGYRPKPINEIPSTSSFTSTNGTSDASQTSHPPLVELPFRTLTLPVQVIPDNQNKPDPIIFNSQSIYMIQKNIESQFSNWCQTASRTNILTQQLYRQYGFMQPSPANIQKINSKVAKEISQKTPFVLSIERDCGQDRLIDVLREYFPPGTGFATVEKVWRPLSSDRKRKKEKEELREENNNQTSPKIPLVVID